MTVKACVSKGQEECVRGFHRDQCDKCTKGSISCNMCHSDSSSTCIYCSNGVKECDDCFGLGHIQRICRPCVNEHYRRQSPKTATKVKSQIVTAQNQFSKSMDSLTTAITCNINTMGPSLHKSGHHSDTDVSKLPISSTIRSAASTLEKLTSKLTSKSTDQTSNDGTKSTKTHRRKWSWASFNGIDSPTQSASAA
ncbi:hypothetical protein BGZ76_005374 [Entomortierella beljakovae]|nr:hypothetical protein BGZ76_005374 [Entomortierella beljakovae]